MNDVIRHAKNGGLVLGICNGFQILIETGLQNGTLAIVVTGLIFNDPIYLVPTATYALIMYAVIFVYVIGLKYNKSSS